MLQREAQGRTSTRKIVAIEPLATDEFAHADLVESVQTLPNIETGFHLHIYGGNGTSPDESTVGSQVVEHSKYYFEDQEPSVRKTSDPDFAAIGDARKVCARIAHSGHGLAKAHDGTYHTGNCVPIQRY